MENNTVPTAGMHNNEMGAPQNPTPAAASARRRTRTTRGAPSKYFWNLTASSVADMITALRSLRRTRTCHRHEDTRSHRHKFDETAPHKRQRQTEKLKNTATVGCAKVV
jgi:hypothetical protein